MPMVDYLCETCDYRFEGFFHDPPLTQSCPKIIEDGIVCGSTAHLHTSLPGEYRPTNARHFSPITIWVSNSDPNKYSFPGRSDEPVDAGYHAVEITSIQEADKWTKKINEVERNKSAALRDLNREFFDERRKSRRDDTRARIRGNARAEALFRSVQEYTDKQRERKQMAKGFDPNFHIQVLSNDSSNRQSYSGPETNWRDRKS